MKKAIVFLSIFFLSPLPLLAEVAIVEVFPNTDDDANMEYIDIANTGCESIDISGYQIADKEKPYTFAAGSMLASHEIYRVGRPLSKLVLNNTDEELYLRDTSTMLIDTFSYTTSTKGAPIVVPGISYDTCSLIEEQAGEEQTGEVDTEDDVEETPDAEVSIDDGGSGGSSDTGGADVGEDGGPGTDSSDAGMIQDEGTGSTSGGGTEEEEEENTEDIVDEGADTEYTEEDPMAKDGVQTTNLLGKSGSLDPQILLYSDSDEDGYIDTLEILYDIYLTGIVDIDTISLYSATGGLYDYRVNTATGYILDAEIEENKLRFFIQPATLEKSTLSIDGTTASALRLKSPSMYGVTSLSGASVGAFLLTSSFDSYRSVYESSLYQAMLEDRDTPPDTVSPGVFPGFPDIIPTIQNYTNTSYSDGAFTCRESPCRLNLTFENIFSTLYTSADYSCEITYGTVTESKCNPSQWNPTGATGFDVKLIHKATGISHAQYFPIYWNPVVSSANPTTPIVLSDISAPVVHIKLNGTLTKKQILTDENTLHCYTQTCSVNFDGTDSYDPDQNTMTYAWLSDGNIFSTKKNPGVQDFTLGEHAIVFRITDASGKVATEDYTIIVHGDVPIDREVQIAGNTDTNSVKKKNLKKFAFFSPPKLILENPSSKIAVSDGIYTCVSTTTSCSMNWALADTVPGVSYQFRYRDETDVTWSINPRSRSLKTGNYTLMVSAYYTKGGEPIWSQEYPIHIIRIKKAATPKKTPTQKATTTSTKKGIEIIPSAYADDGSVGDTTDKSILFVLFLSVLVNIFFLRKKLGISV